MSVLSRADMVKMIKKYIEAEQAIITGQSYTIGNRSLTRANLSEIRDARQEWEQRLDNYDIRQRGGNHNSSVATW